MHRDKTRILLVDDSATVRSYYRQALAQGNFVIDEAENGIEAMEKVLEVNYGLILVDVNMPKMDGYTFVRKVREGAASALAPIAMITSEQEAKDRAEAYRSGANLYLVKPLRGDALLEFARMLTGESA